MTVKTFTSKSWFRTIALVAAFAVFIPASIAFAFAGEKDDTKAIDSSAQQTEQNAEPQSETTKSVQEDVDKAVEEKTDEKQTQLIQEATTAIEQTRKALSLLDEKKTDEALAKLKEAVGTIELVVARNPRLAFAPVGVVTSLHDVIAKPETVEEIVEKAQEALDDGHVQVARRLLDGLASEVVINTEKLPLATYPDAIKDAVPLIDDGKFEEAKTQLELALSLLVVDRTIVPLPETRAEAMLKEAEKLAEKKDRSKEDSQRLKDLVQGVRDTTELGHIMGYITEDNAESINDELDKITEKTSGGKSGNGFFDKIRDFFS